MPLAPRFNFIFVTELLPGMVVREADAFGEPFGPELEVKAPIIVGPGPRSLNAERKPGERLARVAVVTDAGAREWSAVDVVVLLSDGR